MLHCRCVCGRRDGRYWSCEPAGTSYIVVAAVASAMIWLCRQTTCTPLTPFTTDIAAAKVADVHGGVGDERQDEDADDGVGQGRP
jgi:hypothetical protein